MIFFKGKNKLTEKFLLALNDSGQIHVVPSMVNDIFVIRFAICAKDASEYDIHIAFQIIQTHADGILFEHKRTF
jgi:aromatic-L-amino-acid decarboxylase